MHIIQWVLIDLYTCVITSLVKMWNTAVISLRREVLLTDDFGVTLECFSLSYLPAVVNDMV